MAMVGVDSGSLQADSQPKSFGLAWPSEGRRPLGAVLHSSNELGEPSKRFTYDDSTINIGICTIIIIIIIIIICRRNRLLQHDKATWLSVVTT